RAMEDMHEAATGAIKAETSAREESGFEATRIAGYLRETSEQLRTAKVPAGALPIFAEVTDKLAELGEAVESGSTKISIESLEQNLIALEDQMFAALQAFMPAEESAALREQSARELAPYRSRLQTVQIRQIEQQFLRRSLFQKNGIPRLSLFYMRQS
ncbi:MAG: hypothetical protein ABI164_11975, partial [Acidobacteriaceae bacterium]